MTRSENYIWNEFKQLVPELNSDADYFGLFLADLSLHLNKVEVSNPENFKDLSTRILILTNKILNDTDVEIGLKISIQDELLEFFASTSSRLELATKQLSNESLKFLNEAKANVEHFKQ